MQVFFFQQFVVAAREWSSDLHKLVNKISNSNISKEFNIIVSNVLELPIVGKMQTRVEVLNNVDEKQQKVLKIIDEVKLWYWNDFHNNVKGLD